MLPLPKLFIPSSVGGTLVQMVFMEATMYLNTASVIIFLVPEGASSCIGAFNQWTSSLQAVHVA